MNNTRLLYIFFFLLIAYLVMNTGLFSDDFDAMARIRSGSFKDNLIPNINSYFVDTPVEHFTHFLWYRVFSLYNTFLISVVKMIYMMLAFFMISRFFKIYMEEPLALLASFLFVFFPCHDSTVYMFMCQYLTLSFAFYFYAYYLAYRDKLLLAFLLGLAASFVSYGSIPIAIGLSALFIVNKNFKKAASLLLPNIVYSVYFVYLTVLLGKGHPRTLETVSLVAIIKQYALQVLTFMDASLGPSMWLKVYYSFSQLSWVSFVIGVILTIVCYRIIRRCAIKYNSKLIISFSILLAVSFLIFSMTGRYPQICFNLGNRVTIYGSLLLAYLIVSMPARSRLKILLLALLIFSILGISDHWKGFTAKQQKVICNIRDNKALRDYSDTRPIYVSGSQYSKYGPISNIEFFSEAWVPTSIFKLAFGRAIEALPLNRRFVYRDGYLTDTKYSRREKVEGYINVYDSEKDAFFRINADSIKGYIDSLPPDRRHWVQLIDNEDVKELILKLMPRLKYTL